MWDALWVTALAGLATAVGGTIAVVRKPSKAFMAVSMGVAAGVMVCISVMDMLPEALEHYLGAYSPLGAGLCVVSLFFMGLVIAGIMEGILPEERNSSGVEDDKSKVMRSAVVTAAAILLHNLPEGVLTLFAGVADPQMGLRLAVAVGLHNLPEGIAVAAPLYYATNKRGRAAGVAIFSGVAEPVGAALAFLLLGRFLTPGFLNGLLALVSGIMCWVSVFELLPTGFSFGKKAYTCSGFGLGVAAMILGISLLS